MSLDIKIGSYSLGDYIDTFEITQDSRVEQVAIPRRHGLLSDEGYKTGMTLKIGGLIYNSDYTVTRTILTSIKGALSLGKIVFTVFSDRQVTVQKSYFSSSYEDQDLRRIRWEAELLADDFGFVAVDPTISEKTISASPQTDTFTNDGNLDADSIIRITAGASDIASGLRIDNLTNAKFFTYNAVISAGNWIEIDTDLLTVVDQLGVNQLANFQGDFFKLAGGSNSVKWTGTATGSPKLKMTYRSKYDGH